MKGLSCNKTIITLLLVALVLASVFAVFTPSQTVEALIWGGKDSSDLWYYGKDYLDVDSAREVVKTWNLSKVSKPIVIAVIDTGIDAKHDLFADDENGVSVLAKNDKGEILGYNSYKGADENGNVDISDASSKHGSAVAGNIAMLIREFGLENCIKIYPIKANTTGATNTTGDSTFKLESLSRALDWAVDNAKADVVNMSLGLTGGDIESLIKSKQLTQDEANAFEVAVEKARRNAVVSAAAGNNKKSDQNASDLFYPAAYPGVLSAMNQYKSELYSTSNFGSTYTLCAPGFGIYTSKGYQSSKSVYGTEQGTSMSASFVSFAAALLKLRCEIEGRNVDSVTLAQLVEAIMTKTLKKNDVEYKTLDLNAIVTTDLDGVKIGYEQPKSIIVKHDGKVGEGDYAGMVYMRADNAYELTLYAQIDPVGKVDPDVENALEWTVQQIASADDDTPVSEAVSIGKGTSVKYTPKRGGDFIVKAKIPGYSATQSVQIHIEYGIYYVGEVRVTLADNAQKDVSEAPSSATIYTRETTRFALTGVKYLNPDVETKWYVNGEYVASGEVFEFTPKKAGTYYITARYGDNAMVDFQYKFTANVKSAVLRPLDLSFLIVGLVAAVAIVVTVTVFAVRKKNTNTTHDTERTQQ